MENGRTGSVKRQKQREKWKQRQTTLPDTVKVETGPGRLSRPCRSLTRRLQHSKQVLADLGSDARVTTI